MTNVIAKNDMCEVEAMVEMDKFALIEMILDLTKKVTKPAGRKEQVLELLKAGTTNIQAIADEIGVSTKNISSQLTYLRKDGHAILSYRMSGKSFLKYMPNGLEEL